MPDTTLTSAIDQLQNHQTQLDMDGVAVGVSRQAIDIVLAALSRAGLEAGKAEEWKLIGDTVDASVAPWDGTPVLVRQTGVSEPDVFVCEFDVSWSAGGWWLCCDGKDTEIPLRGPAPKYWMRVPAIRALPLTGGKP